MVELLRTPDMSKKTRKVTKAIKEPGADNKNWPRKELVMVVAHQGSGMQDSASHYLSFTKAGNAWWKVDTGTQTITEENPFQTQMGSPDESGFTINLLLFKDMA